MRFRFIRIVALSLVVAGAFAGVAQALDWDDEDPEPPVGEVGALYNYEAGSHAGCLPHHYVVNSGALPPGLKLSNLNDHTALVDGIPTEAGAFTAWIAVQDCAGKSAESLFRFDVGPRTYAIKTSTLPAAATGSPYSAKLQAGDHPTKSVKWGVTSGSLPAGLTLATDGTISGIPTTSVAATFTVTVTSVGADDGHTRTDSRQFTLNVLAPLAAKISRRDAEVRVPFRSALVATGGQSPYSWSATGAPGGLSVASNGVISGVPTRAGSYTLTAHLVDANGATKDLQVTLIVHPRLAIATKRLPAAVAGHAYRAKIAVRGGVARLRWAIARGALPRGLKLGANTGTISGAPAITGTFRMTLRVRDALGAISTKTLVLSVH